MLVRRILFWPFTVLYGTILHTRHALYNLGILRSTRPATPTIAIGNLALGGTGKTPMMELILSILADVTPLGTLSRGYGRKTTSIHEVRGSDDVELSGDEPVQVKRKFPGIRVFVGADRMKAIALIEREVPGIKAVVLDDALQHRRLDAGLNILLTTFQRPYCDDALIPAGQLRDVRSRAKAAQIVVVTKCPGAPAQVEQRLWRERLGLASEQRLYFAGIEYEAPRTINGDPAAEQIPQETSALVFTGIAQPEPFLLHIRSRFEGVEPIAFPDHHPFTLIDLHKLADRFHKFAPGPKTLITTEKDAARLRSVIPGSPLEGLPLIVIGMRAVILNEPEHFADLIRNHVGPHQAHR